MNSLLNKITDFVKNNTYFGKEYEGEDYVNFTTRRFGNISYGKYGDEDYDEARRIKKLVEEKFNNSTIKTDIDTIDEWVEITISIENEK